MLSIIATSFWVQGLLNPVFHNRSWHWVIQFPYEHIFVHLFEKLQHAVHMDTRASNG